MQSNHMKIHIRLSPTNIECQPIWQKNIFLYISQCAKTFKHKIHSHFIYINIFSTNIVLELFFFFLNINAIINPNLLYKIHFIFLSLYCILKYILACSIFIIFVTVGLEMHFHAPKTKYQCWATITIF